MKKVVLYAVSCLLITSLVAQETPETPKKEKKKQPINLAGRANDHFMIQLGYTGWSGKPDTINTSGWSKSFNVYFMFDFPFKTNPKLSMAFGPGIASDHVKFSRTYVGIKETTPTLQFRDLSDTNHFKKVKLNTTYLEAPIEFRYTANPMNSDKSFKFAIGAKVGTMIKVHTRNKEFENKSGGTLNSYTMKESSKRVFNTTSLVVISSVGVGLL